MVVSFYRKKKVTEEGYHSNVWQNKKCRPLFVLGLLPILGL